MPTEGTEKKVQFYFAQEAIEELDELQKSIGSASRADTIRHALRLLQWVNDEIQKGNNLCLETKEGIVRVFMPYLPSKRRSDKLPVGHESKNGVS